MGKHSGPLERGRTRWWVFAGAFAVSGTAAAGLVAATAAGAVPASVALSGAQFKVSASRLEGTGFTQFARVDRSTGGGRHAVAVSGISSAQIHDLCQSAVIPTPFGPVTLRVSAGTDEPVRARDLVLDLNELSGDVTFTDLYLGVDAAEVDDLARGEPGTYAQQAGTVVIEDLRQSATSTTAGTFRLEGMRLSARPGRHECY